jgi:hypothetical protein
MAVIINELEIVVEPPEEQPPDAAAPEGAAMAPARIEPMDLADFLERRARLMHRVVAH